MHRIGETSSRATTLDRTRRLRISLLGGVRVSRGGAQPVPTTRRIQTLLAYLVLQRRRYHSREVLAGVFWGEQREDSARGCLNTALWRLRRILEPPGVRRGTYLVRTAGGDVAFNAASDHWLDVDVLEAAAGRLAGLTPGGAAPGDRDAIEAAVGLYAGDLLDGVYADWALRERERLRLLHLDCLSWLLNDAVACDARSRAVAWGQLLLAHDPLREDVHQTMMRLHALAGQRGAALAQYETCRAALAGELDVEPTVETRALHAMLAGTNPAAVSDVTPGRLLELLRGIARRAEQLRSDVEHAIRLVERVTPPARR